MELERIKQVTRKNLVRLDKQKLSVDTRRCAHIRELAKGLFTDMPTDEDGIEEFRHYYEETVSELGLSLRDRVMLCRYMAENTRLWEKLLSVAPQKKRCLMSYVKNPLTDLAYEQFSGCFDRAAVSYAADFVSAAEDVYHSVTDYVILPVSSERTGRMKSFSDLADKYELKKVLCCNVYSNTEDTETEFALFSKDYEKFFGTRGRALFFEFSVPMEDIIRCNAFIDELGCEVVSVNSDDGRVEYCLELSESDAEALCVYLVLEAPAHSVKGIF